MDVFLPGTKLKSYQEETIAFAKQHRRIIIADEMGLGKSLSALTAAIELGAQRILVVAPKYAFGVWEEEIAYWVPGARTYTYTGAAAKRMAVAKRLISEQYSGPVIMITNPQMAYEMSNNWDAVFVDEVHTGFRNKDNKGYKAVAKKTPNATDVYLLTGSPVVKGPEDIFHYLHLLAPKEFSSYWQWLYTHCRVIKTPFGIRIDGVKNPDTFKEHLRPYMIRHLSDDYQNEIPPKTRMSVPIEMLSEQKALYATLVDDMFADLGPDEPIMMVGSNLAVVTRLRQTLVSPALYGGPEMSAGMRTLKEMRRTIPGHMVLFCSYREGLEQMKKHVDPKMTFIRGGMDPDAIKATAKAFQDAPANENVTIGVTIKSAQSFNLSSASTAIVLGPEWTATEMAQAEDRLHRMGQKNPVHIHYLLHKGTVEDRVMEVVNDKAGRAIMSLTRADFYGNSQ